MRYSTVHQLIVNAFVLWFGSYAYLYIYSFTDFKPLYSFFLFFGYFVLSIFVSLNLRSLSKDGTRPLIFWLGMYLVYGCWAFFNSTQSDQAIQAIFTLGTTIFLLGAFAVLFSDPLLLRRTRAALSFLVLLAALVNVYDFFNPFYTNVPGRAAGLYVNPNIAGQFIAMAMVAGVNSVRQRWRLVFVLVCGVGVLLTFSRGAWILWGLGVMGLGCAGVIIQARYRIIAFVLGSVIGFGLIALLYTGALGSILDQTGYSIYLDANTLARLGMEGSQLQDYAAQTRISLITESLRIGAEAPFLGHGLGYANEWLSYGTHNMYLLFWAEGGLLGLLLYIGLMLLLFLKSIGIGRILVVQLIIAGVFTHNQLEQPAFLMFIALSISHNTVMRSLSSPALRGVPHTESVMRA